MRFELVVTGLLPDTTFGLTYTKNKMEQRELKKEKNKTKNRRQGVMKRVTGRNYFDGDIYKKKTASIYNQPAINFCEGVVTLSCYGNFPSSKSN